MGKARNFLRGEVPYRLAVHARGEQSVSRRLSDLRRLERESPDSILEDQRHRLSDILNYASTRVPFYRGLGAPERVKARDAAEPLRGSDPGEGSHPGTV